MWWEGLGWSEHKCNILLLPSGIRLTYIIDGMIHRTIKDEQKNDLRLSFFCSLRSFNKISKSRTENERKLFLPLEGSTTKQMENTLQAHTETHFYKWCIQWPASLIIHELFLFVFVIIIIYQILVLTFHLACLHTTAQTATFTSFYFKTDKT